MVGPLAEPKAYKESKQEPTKGSMTKQAVKPGRPGHLTGMERPISSVQAGERSDNKKPALPLRLDLRARPEARALAGLRYNRRRCLQGREENLLSSSVSSGGPWKGVTKRGDSNRTRISYQTRYVSPANEG